MAGAVGVIVSVGVTVDSYVVYFERLKDEIRAGRSIRSSIDRSFNRAYRTILTADGVRDLVEKATKYARHGLVDYWVVDPVGHQVLTHRLVDGSYVVTGEHTSGRVPLTFAGIRVEEQRWFDESHAEIGRSTDGPSMKSMPV